MINFYCQKLATTFRFKVPEKSFVFGQFAHFLPNKNCYKLQPTYPAENCYIIKSLTSSQEEEYEEEEEIASEMSRKEQNQPLHPFNPFRLHSLIYCQQNQHTIANVVLQTWFTTQCSDASDSPKSAQMLGPTTKGQKWPEVEGK